MRSLIVHLILILIIGSDCKIINSQDSNALMIKQLDKDYQERKSFFRKELINHFPKKLDTTYITFTDCESPDIGTLTLRLTIRYYDKTRINKIINKSIAHYASNDSCLLIVNRFATIDRFYKLQPSEEEKEIIDKDCYKDKLPIPNFWDSQIISETTYTKLPEDFIIYVLDAKRGEFMHTDFLTDGKSMPPDWKNGYTKGISVSEKRQIVIYWVDIW
jgi:hypothetical protein